VPLFNGTHIVIPSSRGFRDRRAISNYWRFVQRYRVTVGAGVPTVLAALAAVAPDGPVTSLKRILVGGAPLARATIARIVEITGGAEVIEGWGMTETCGFSVMNPYGRTKVGSVGLPFPESNSKSGASPLAIVQEQSAASTRSAKLWFAATS